MKTMLMVFGLMMTWALLLTGCSATRGQRDGFMIHSWASIPAQSR